MKLTVSREGSINEVIYVRGKDTGKLGQLIRHIPYSNMYDIMTIIPPNTVVRKHVLDLIFDVEPDEDELVYIVVNELLDA